MPPAPSATATSLALLRHDHPRPRAGVPAGSLARELYATVKREGVVVAPLCPYVVKWAERHPQEAPAAGPELLNSVKRWLEEYPRRF